MTNFVDGTSLKENKIIERFARYGFEGNMEDGFTGQQSWGTGRTPSVVSAHVRLVNGCWETFVSKPYGEWSMHVPCPPEHIDSLFKLLERGLLQPLKDKIYMESIGQDAVDQIEKLLNRVRRSEYTLVWSLPSNHHYSMIAVHSKWDLNNEYVQRGVVKSKLIEQLAEHMVIEFSLQKWVGNEVKKEPFIIKV